MALEIISVSIFKHGTWPGLNLRPLDLQSDNYLQPDMLPTALRGLAELQWLDQAWGHEN